MTGSADPHAKGRSGSSAIHGAVSVKVAPAWTLAHGFGVAEQARSGLVELLLDRGVDPNAVGAKGQTALILASRNARVEVVKLLLSRGADPNIPGIDGKSAVDVAGNLHCLHLLRRNIELRQTRHGRYEARPPRMPGFQR